jgi:tetratricopeptide (TPR) repeat protein
MPTFYFSYASCKSEPVVERLAATCESFLEGKCVLGRARDGFIQEETKKSLAQCDALFVVIEKELSSAGGSGSLIDDPLLNERLRFEIVTAMNFDLLIVTLLIDDVILPEKKNAPGAWKRLLECNSYRLRNAYWSHDLHQFLEDIEEELDFKKEVKKKLSQSIYQNYQDLTDAEGKPLQPLELGLEFSGSLELRRVIESERFNLEEARRIGDRAREKNALSALGLAFTKLGQTQRAIEYFQEQLVIVREAENVEEECELLASLGDAFAVSGNIDAAKKCYEEQLLRADSKGLRALVGSAYNGLGYVYVKKDKIARAIACYLKALAIYREFENHDKELELLVGIGLNYQKSGELEQATEYLELALKAAKYLENRKEEAHVLVDLAEVCGRLENPKRAEVYLNGAEEILNARMKPWAVALRQRLTELQNSLKRT